MKQLFDIALKDRIIAESPAKSLRLPWKKPQAVRRQVPSVAQFEAIVADIRSQVASPHAQETGDFVEFLGLAGLGQAEASSLTWGDVDWQRNRLNIRRHKTDTHFFMPIYDHLRPLLERLRKERRGRVLSTSLVFRIKDAKKGLRAACQRLKFPLFCQRSLRQHLIGRLWRAGVDKKLIARWQGHQDGGQLIMDTYTEVFGGDDEEYERSQLAKLNGGGVVAMVPVAQFCGEREAKAPSGTMKKRMKKARPRRASVAPATPVPSVDAIPAAAIAVDPVKAVPLDPPPVALPGTAPSENPYRKGDKVKTKCKGQDVEAEVTNVWKDEVQVRTPDGELRWRTVRTVDRIVAEKEVSKRLNGAKVARTKKRSRKK